MFDGPLVSIARSISVTFGWFVTVLLDPFSRRISVHHVGNWPVSVEQITGKIWHPS